MMKVRTVYVMYTPFVFCVIYVICATYTKWVNGAMGDILDEDAYNYQPNSAHVNSASGKLSRQFDTNIAEDEQDIPIILWWTDRLMHHEERAVRNLSHANCPHSQCYRTKDRKYMTDNRTRVIFIYGTDMDTDDLPLPRAEQHEWALAHEESPFNNYMFSHDVMLRLFNYTATTSRNSDYPLASQYLISLNYLTERQPLPIAEKNRRKLKMGLAPVLYVQSHCDVASDRDRYVKELMKYINIDSYGQCLNNKKMPPVFTDSMSSFLSEAYYDFIADYKFHLAFENALCDDYMTEKLFRVMHVGSVPVYRGSSLAKDWMPNNQSIIMVDDFPSPEHLANFIKQLDADDKEYEKYLHYKTRGGITNSFLLNYMKKREWGINEYRKPSMFGAFECYVCDQVSLRHAKERQQKFDKSVVLSPPKFANGSHYACPQPRPSLGTIDDITDKNDGWLRKRWVEDYWSGKDRAVALTEMIRVKETNRTSFNNYWLNVARKYSQRAG